MIRGDGGAENRRIEAMAHFALSIQDVASNQRRAEVKAEFQLRAVCSSEKILGVDE